MNNPLKKKLPVLIIFISLTSVFTASGQASPWEIQGLAESYLPEEAVWNHAEGAEARLIGWARPEFGIAFSAGLSQWAPDGSTRQIPVTVGQRWHDIHGKAQYTSLGISALFRSPPQKNGMALAFEAGIRHLIYDADMALMETNRIPGASVDRVDAYPLDLGNGVVARLAGTLAWPLGGKSTLRLTGGYQFDLDPSEITLSQVTFSDGSHYRQTFDLSAYFLQFGIGIPLD